jgi:hypothetical protein
MLEDEASGGGGILAVMLKAAAGVLATPPQTLRELGEEHTFSRERIRQTQEHLSRSGLMCP